MSYARHIVGNHRLLTQLIFSHSNISACVEIKTHYIHRYMFLCDFKVINAYTSLLGFVRRCVSWSIYTYAYSFCPTNKVWDNRKLNTMATLHNDNTDGSIFQNGRIIKPCAQLNPFLLSPGLYLNDVMSRQIKAIFHPAHSVRMWTVRRYSVWGVPPSSPQKYWVRFPSPSSQHRGLAQEGLTQTCIWIHCKSPGDKILYGRLNCKKKKEKRNV